LITRRILALAGTLLVAAFAASCDSTNAPQQNTGQIVLHFDNRSSAPGAAPSSPIQMASVFDSVVVNVYHAGSPLRLEVSKGAPVTNDSSIDLAVDCTAESNKKVGVDLYANHKLAYHGSNSDVDVVANQTTGINVDVSAFFVTNLTLTPTVIPNGAAFTLHWGAAPAAAHYRVEESTTQDFATITSQTVVDTTVDVHMGAGSHYFRVRPTTPYAEGLSSNTRFGYVTGGSNQVQVLGVSDTVIPLETISITGENLDFPGTHALMGTDTLSIESSTWGQLVARVPRDAITNKVTVTSQLGSDTSGKEVVVQRIAYVTAFPSSSTTTDFVARIMQFTADFENSGVAVIPLADLDRRDMNVFDVIVVAADTGTLKSNWGGANQGQRVSAIADSDANVLAIGRGGVAFLQNALTSANLTYTTAVDSDRQYFEYNQSAACFTTPHSVSKRDITFCNVASSTVALDIASSPSPAGTALYASTDKSCLIACTPNDKWALADFRFDNTGGKPVIYFFWGYAGAPNDLSADGRNCLGNVVYMLYQ
jgi:hypothetical protein